MDDTFGNRSPPGRRLTWVTRTAPFNLLTAMHLKQAGVNTVLEPALLVRALPMGGPFTVPDALVFTSLQAVRHHRFLASLASRPVFAAGHHTARAARQRGYQCVTSAGGDVHDLHGLIRAEIPTGATILHISATQPAGDLLTLLRQDRYRPQRVCVYETAERSWAEFASVAEQLSGIRAILVHSPRAGRHVAEWLVQSPLAWTGRVCCISATAAAPFRLLSGIKVVVAPWPDEASLIGSLLAMFDAP